MAACCSVPAMPIAPIPWPVPCTSWNMPFRLAMPRSTMCCGSSFVARCRWCRGQQKTFVEGPVDYTDLRTEFIGLIYEGLLDYRLKRTDEQTGPQVFLNLGREPVLPLSRLRDMLENDRKGLKDLLTTLKKEKVTASVAAEEEEADEEAEEQDGGEEETTEEAVVEADNRYRSNPTPRRLPRCRGSSKILGQGSGRPGRSDRQARQEGNRQRIPDPDRGRSDQAHQSGRGPRRVLSGPGRQYPQGHRNILYPAPVGRSNRPPHVGAAVLRQSRRWHAHPQDPPKTFSASRYAIRPAAVRRSRSRHCTT